MASGGIAESHVIQDTEFLLLNAPVVRTGVCAFYCVKDSALNVAGEALLKPLR